MREYQSLYELERNYGRLNPTTGLDISHSIILVRGDFGLSLPADCAHSNDPKSSLCILADLFFATAMMMLPEPG